MKNKHADRKLKPDRKKFQSNLQSHSGDPQLLLFSLAVF